MVKISSKNEFKCYKLKKINEILPKSLKIGNCLTPENYKTNICPTYVINIEKDMEILIKTTSHINLCLYQFTYKNFKSDFSDLFYKNFNFTNPIFQTYTFSNDVLLLPRGTYFLRLENFMNNKIYEHLKGCFFN